MNRCTFSLFCILYLVPWIAWSDDLDEALKRWDTKTALELVQTDLPRSKAAALYGYMAFLEGDYGRAEGLLRKVSGPDRGTKALLTIVAFTRATTQDMVVATSEKGHFSLRYRPGHDEAAVFYILEAAEAMWDVLMRRFDAHLEGPVRIELLPSFEALAASTGLNMPEVHESGAVAVCKFNKVMLVSPSALPWGYPYADTMAHELTHYVLTRLWGEDLPLWFQEGVAKYLESTWRGKEPGQLTRGARERLATAVVEGRLIPFDSLRDSLAWLPADAVSLAFAELSSFIGALEAAHGPKVLARLAVEMGRDDPVVAFSRVTGRTLGEAVAAWARDLSALRPSAGHVVLVQEPEQDLFKRLPPQAMDAIRLGDMLATRGKAMAAAEQYRKVSEQHPAVVARLAAALLAASRPEEAIFALDAAMLDEEEYPILAGLRGRALVALGRQRDAIQALWTAVRCDPYDPNVHRALAQALRASGDGAGAEREERLAAMWSAR